MSIGQLSRYLVDMGRCGRHYSLHDAVDYHDYKCRRATLALHLMEPAKRTTDAFKTEFDQNDGSVTEITSFDAEFASHYLTELIEAVNGGRYLGIPFVFFEAPEIYTRIADSVEKKAKIASFRFETNGAILQYANGINELLRMLYKSEVHIDISENALRVAGLEDDEEEDLSDL